MKVPGSGCSKLAAKMRAVLFAVAAVFIAAIGLQAPAPAVSSGDPALNADRRYPLVRAQAQSGSGKDDGTYLPPLAGPTSEIAGTVVADTGAGPTAFYVGAVDNKGTKHFWRGMTDEHGRFHLRLPRLATGIAELLLFKHFDRSGAPDEGASCKIAGRFAHLVNTEAVINPPVRGPAIIETSTAFERGGFGQSLIQLHTRGMDPLQSRVLLDGSTRDVDTLAASDASLVGKMHDNVALGRHRVGAQSGNQRTNEQEADIVSETFEPIGTLRMGDVRPVRLHIDGLNGDPSTVTFEVSGAADVASGGNTITVPVSRGTATCDIRASHPGALLIRTLLHVALQLVAIIPPGIGPVVERLTPPPTVPVSGEPTPTIIPHNNPSPSGPPTPTPPATHPPPHHPPTCYLKYEGYMEPSQGVWQDDYKFVDKPTKQLDQLSPASYRAELDMVKGRDSLLFGIYRPVHHAPQELRDSIVIRGETNYSVEILAKVKFSLLEGQKYQKLYETPLEYKAYKRPCGTTVHKFEAVVPSAKGIPPDKTFQFTKAGRYVIYAVLVDRNDDPICCTVTVDGKSVETHGPVVHFIPALAGKEGAAKITGVVNRTELLAETSAHYIPIYFPLTADGLTAVVRKRINLDSYIAQADEIKAGGGPVMSNLAEKIIAPAIVSKYTAIGNIGVGRIVIVVDESAAKILSEDAGGNTYSTKVIFLRDTANFIQVAHELIHTEPEYLWSSDQMIGDCAYDYHNNANTDVVNGVKDRGLQPNGSIIGHAYGVRTEEVPAWVSWYKEDTLGLTKGTSNAVMAQSLGDALAGTDPPAMRERFYRSYEIMGSAGGPGNTAKKRWITQCSYWHLVDAFQKPQDPRLIQIRGILGRHNGRYGLFVQPFYNNDGLPDLPPGVASSWAIKLKSSNGRVLATYPFLPQWRYPDSIKEVDAIALAYGVPDRSDAASIEVDGPNGVLADVHRSSGAPAIAFEGISNGATVSARAGTVRVHWSARGTSGRQLLSSVLYSSNGRVWMDRLFESKDTSYDLPVGPGRREHWIKLVVTDGTRSTWRIVHFRTQR